MPGYEGEYEATSDGQVWTCERVVQTRRGPRTIKAQMLVGNVSGHTYRRVGIRRRPVPVHTIIAETFIGPRPEGMEVRHLDGDPHNNAVSNLVYGTHAENVADTMQHGNHTMTNRTHCPQGHPYDEVNTMHRDGRRFCLTCKRARGRVYARMARARLAGVSA